MAESRPTVWLVGLYFGTGPSPTGVLLESLAAALTERGYAVEGLAGRAAYNRAAVAAGGRFGGPVRRLFSGPANPTGVLGRLLAWGGFYLTVAAVAFARRRPDVAVLTTTPPLLHAAFALRRLVRRDGGRLVLWNQDTYPDVLAAVGLLSAWGIPYRLLAAVMRWATRRMDVTIALDGAMAGRLRVHGAGDVRIIPNWDAPNVPPPEAPADELDLAVARIRRRHRWLLLYTGNYGWGHDLRPLLDWLRANPDQTDFGLVCVGGGEKWAELTAAAGELGADTVAAFPYVSRERVAGLIATADFGLVSLEDGCRGLMSPSKIHGYLAAGKPLVYLGPAGSNVAEAVDDGCGLRAGYDDPAALPALLATVAAPGFDYPGMSAAAARRGRDRHTEAAAADAFDALFRSLLPGGPARA